MLAGVVCVPTTVIVFAPTFSVMGPLAVPGVTATVLTVTVAVPLTIVGVTVMVPTEFGTLAE